MPGQTFPYNGSIYEVQPDGTARKVAPVQQGIPASPIKVQEAQTNIAQGQASANRSNIGAVLDAAKIPVAPRIAQADAAKAEADAVIAQRNATTLSDDQRKARMQGGNLDALVQQINRAQGLYDQNQAGVGLGSLMEYLPLPGNAQFDTAAAGLAEQGLSAFRTPGVGSQSDAELLQFVEANKPSSWSQDSSNTERLRQLRLRTEAVRSSLGLPKAQWSGAGQRDISALQPEGARGALSAGISSLQQQTGKLTPDAKKRATQAFYNNPDIQKIRKRAAPSWTGFSDAQGGGLQSSPEDQALLAKYGVR